MKFELNATIDIGLSDLIEAIFADYTIEEIENELAPYGFVFWTPETRRSSMINIKNKNPLSLLNDNSPLCNPLFACATCDLDDCPPNCKNLKRVISFFESE